MREDSTQQSVLFEGWFTKPVVAMFDQPLGTSDGGAVLLRGADDRLGLTASMASVLTDRRDPERVQHSFRDVLRQRVVGIACGYEDGNDAARLRGDPVHKLVVDRDPQRGLDLASQPTLSRFENGVTRREVFEMGVALAEGVIERHRARRNGRAKRITVDVDGTDDPTHGAQQGALFNGFYGEHCYLPLVASMQFEQEADQYVLTSLLRKGNAPPALGATGLLRRILARLRAAFPKARLRVRLDGGFATPHVFDFLEGQGVEYVVGIGKNPVLERLAEPRMREVREASAASGQSERRYGHAPYQARSWPHERTVVYKSEVTWYPGREARDNPRFVITNINADPEVIYRRIYAKRGDMENRLKELQEHLAADRLSCTRFLANQARLLLHTAAYALYQELRLHAAGTSLARAYAGTLRERLIKLGGWIKTSARRTTLHLPQDAPWQQEWRHVARALQATSTA
ncbi:MAG: IS1380 family transposase [Trueperaceae bacterium]|nr:IS1380 family transposase [Trueperaceae bacterium]